MFRFGFGAVVAFAAFSVALADKASTTSKRTDSKRTDSKRTEARPENNLARPASVTSDLPLASAQWTSLRFKKIKANEVEFGDQHLKVKVRSSASPLIHALPQPLRVQAVRIHGSWQDMGSPGNQPGDFDEDSLLRVGLVVPGKLTLSGPKRWLAADWVKRLFELAPQGSGIDRIDFLMFTSREDWIGRDRVHPSSELIRERKMSLRPQPGDFETLWKLPDPIQVAAIWLSADGDDGGAQFDLRLTKLQLVLAQD